MNFSRCRMGRRPTVAERTNVNDRLRRRGMSVGLSATRMACDGLLDAKAGAEGALRHLTDTDLREQMERALELIEDAYDSAEFVLINVEDD